jgi:hypothetical protein
MAWRRRCEGERRGDERGERESFKRERLLWSLRNWRERGRVGACAGFPEKEGGRLEKKKLIGGARQSEREGEGQVGLGWFGLLG